jgi:PEP-CTERM motif
LADVTSASGLSLSETVATPGANEGEAGIAPSTLNKLNNGSSPVTLNDVMTSGPAAGDATWAFQWDVTIAPGGSFLISKDKALDVPEPGCLSLLSLGLVAFAARKFRRIG